MKLMFRVELCKLQPIAISTLVMCNRSVCWKLEPLSTGYRAMSLHLLETEGLILKYFSDGTFFFGIEPVFARELEKRGFSLWKRREVPQN